MQVHPGPHLDEQGRIVTVEAEPKLMHLACEICGGRVERRVARGSMQPFIVLCRYHPSPTIDEYVDGHVKRYGDRSGKWADEERTRMQRWASGEGYC